MADMVVALDTAQPPGQQLAPEMVAEIVTVAPSAVVNGSITTAKLADLSVTTPKIVAGAVTSTKIGTGEVQNINLAIDSVTTPKLADDAVTPPKCGNGIVLSVDASNNPIQMTFMYLTAAQWAAVSTPDPNVTYFVV